MPPRHVRTLDRPFQTSAEKWEQNKGPSTVSAAIINRTDADPLTGIRIKQESSGAFFILPDEHAIRLANRIIDIIEAREEREQA